MVLGLFLSSSSYANILNIKCQFDQTREPGFGNKTKKNWFASFKDKMGYKFDIKNLKLIETSYGKYSQKLSLPININDDPLQTDQVIKSFRYVLQQILIAEVPKANGGFGAFISANANGSEIGIASDKGDQKVFTTFDVRFRGDDSTGADGSTTTYDFATTFDKGATRFSTTKA